ncbi:MAG TPA: S-adenosylmethionine decarboxylase [Vicinamibacterales bacterium]|nr:S-adenosylmethionine decarboxylase [Vicinamibacterales bacterium]
MSGVEWVIDARGCDPAKLTDRRVLAELVDAIVGDLSLNVVGEPVWHVFPGAGGITALCLLSESHLAIHTFPEHGSLCLNVFCCRPRGEWDAESRLRNHVAATDIDVARVHRNFAEVSATLP